MLYAAWPLAASCIRRLIEQDPKAQRLGVSEVRLRPGRWELYGCPTRVEVCIGGELRFIPVYPTMRHRRHIVRWAYCPASLRPAMYPHLLRRPGGRPMGTPNCVFVRPARYGAPPRRCCHAAVPHGVFCPQHAASNRPPVIHTKSGFPNFL